MAWTLIISYVVTLTLFTARTSMAFDPGTVAAGAAAAKAFYDAIKGANIYTKKHTPYFDLYDEGERKVSELPVDWKVGSCIMRRGARIEFNRNGTVHFRGEACTTGSISGDVWHGFYDVADDRGVRIYRNRDQFRMPTNKNLPKCRGDRTGNAWVDTRQPFDPETFDAMSQISWEGGC